MRAGSQRLLNRVGDAAAGAGGEGPRHPYVRWALRVGLALVVLGFLIGSVASQWSELSERELQFDALWLAAALVVLVFVHALAGFGWDLILRALHHELPPARAQAIWAQTLLARYVPGTVLMVVGRVLLSEREGVPRRTTIASVVYEQGLMVVAAVAIGAAALIATAPVATAIKVAILAAACLILVALHPRIFQGVADRTLRLFGRDPLPAVLPARAVLSLVGYYLLIWALFGLGAFLAASTVFDLGIDEEPRVTAAQALGYTAALVAVVFPGGLGIRDAVFAVIIDPGLPGGFALAAAIAIAVRLITTIAEVLYTAAALAIDGRRRRRATQALSEAT